MSPETLKKFKTLFESQKTEILKQHQEAIQEFAVSTDDLADETDLASSELEQSMQMRLRNRETLFLRKIEEALARISAGTFGACEECEEPIEARRLEVRPTTTHCLTCKEASEHREALHVDSRKPKSLGTQVRFMKTGS
jgi:DnaK suppressor protein